MQILQNWKFQKYQKFQKIKKKKIIQKQNKYIIIICTKQSKLKIIQTPNIKCISHSLI